MTKVVIGETEQDHDGDRFDVLDDVIERAGFWDRLEERRAETGKAPEKFLVAIKPNIMMHYSQDDTSVITEPALVEHLVDSLIERGYTNVAVVESQNVYGNWFRNREVETVARHAGYEPTNYRLVDLTLDTVAHHYSGKLGQYLVGRTWRDADFRVSFAKNKTHFSCYYTLTIKNVYGCTPEQNKFREYHAQREVDDVTVQLLEEFPVHFGIVDGVWSSDGILGIKADLTPKHTKTIIAGDDLVAVDIVGGRKMGLDPMKNSFVALAADRLGHPDIEVVGDDSVYPDWDNVPPGFEYVLNYGEEWYGFSNLLGMLSSDMDEAFPLKRRAWLTVRLRGVMLLLLRTVSLLEGRARHLPGGR